jgi:hypothetical protein
MLFMHFAVSFIGRAVLHSSSTVMVFKCRFMHEQCFVEILKKQMFNDSSVVFKKQTWMFKNCGLISKFIYHFILLNHLSS